MIQKINRRNFIKLSGLTGTGLILSFPLIAQSEKATTITFEPNGFLKIGTDNSILIYAKNPEIGQGVKTSLPMIIAEELEVDWEQIEVQQANYKFDKSLGSQFAGGSTAIKNNWDALRKVGASAKAMLIQAAATQWGISVGDCYAQSGKVFNSLNKALRFINTNCLNSRLMGLSISSARPFHSAFSYIICIYKTNTISFMS